MGNILWTLIFHFSYGGYPVDSLMRDYKTFEECDHDRKELIAQGTWDFGKFECKGYIVNP